MQLQSIETDPEWVMMRMAGCDIQAARELIEDQSGQLDGFAVELVLSVHPSDWFAVSNRGRMVTTCLDRISVFGAMIIDQYQVTISFCT